MRKIIVANWKMNPETPREAKEIFGPVKRLALKLNRVTTVICPPAVFLPLVANQRVRGGSRLAFGGQDAFGETSGAYTGKIGPNQLYYSGASYLILGHSEARAAGDTDAMVNLKIRTALKTNLKIILCVGERQRDAEGLYLAVIKTQLEEGLRHLPRKNFEQLVVAYEPVWAIGSNARFADTPSAFLEQALYIRKVLAALCGQDLAMKVPILYGGSVTGDNAADFLIAGQADGLLVGRASLDPSEFIKILKIAEGIK